MTPKAMKTPYLDNRINELKYYDKQDMLSDEGRSALIELK